MARSRLGENQIRDEDLLTEAEHAAWDHSTVSGVVTDFISLTDTPNSYSAGKYLYSTASGTDWVVGTIASGTMSTDEVEAISKLHYSSATTLSIVSNEVDWDLTSDSSYGKITLDDDITINKPTGLVDGAIFYLRLTQNETGGHTVSYDAGINFGGVDAPVMVTTASGSMILAFASDGVDVQCWEVWSSE